MELDTSLLKKELEEERTKRDETISSLKTVIKSSLEKLQQTLDQIQENVESEKTFTRGIANWIKNNLGPNLELINQLVDGKVAAELKELDTRIVTQQKEREEG